MGLHERVSCFVLMDRVYDFRCSLGSQVFFLGEEEVIKSTSDVLGGMKPGHRLYFFYNIRERVYRHRRAAGSRLGEIMFS